MNNPQSFRYVPNDEEPLSIAIVSAVAKAHHEDILDQHWILSNDINPEALDALFQAGKEDMTLTFEADDSSVTVEIDGNGEYEITIDSHR